MPIYRHLRDEERQAVLPELLELLEAQRQRPDNLLYIQPREFYERFSSERGAFFVALEANRLMGFQMLGYATAVNALWTPYIQRLGARPEECGVSLQRLVAEEYRGRGVGSSLARMSLRHARERGLRHLFATTHPDNTPSLRTSAACGYRELERKLVYDTQVPRVLLHRRLLPPWRPEVWDTSWMRPWTRP